MVVADGFWERLVGGFGKESFLVLGWTPRNDLVLLTPHVKLKTGLNRHFSVSYEE